MIRLVGTIFCSFFKIGLFTLGGGLAIVSLVQQEMLARGWLTNAEFLDILGIAQMTPRCSRAAGSQIQNFLTFSASRR